jgi:hypothetical protein
MILIIGGRFGGKAVPEAYKTLNRDTLCKALDNGFDKAFDNRIFSITQLEVLKAIEMKIPIWTFVTREVHSDHHVYEKNKDKVIHYPSIDKQETAKYIFEFINLIRKRPTNNSIFPFEYSKDIKDTLTKQFAGLVNEALRKESKDNESNSPVPSASTLDPAKPSITPDLPTNNLPERNSRFSGREVELKNIKDAFEKGVAVCVKQAIAGLGGVGKTQIATEYAYRFGHEYKDAIWWINAEKSPKDDLLNFTEKFEIFPEGRDAAAQMNDDDFIRRLNVWLEEHSSTLLIFDNVESAEVVEQFIPRSGHVLITTRDRRLDLNNIKSVELDVFSDDEAKAFMKERIPEAAIDRKSVV